MVQNKNCVLKRFCIYYYISSCIPIEGSYSEVPNKSVTFLILFWDFYFYLHGLIKDLHVYLFLGKVPTYTVFYVIHIEKFPPTLPYSSN